MFLSPWFVRGQIRLANPDVAFDDLSAQHVADELFTQPVHQAVLPPGKSGDIDQRLDDLADLTANQGLLFDSLLAQHLATGVLGEVVPLLAGRPGVLRDIGESTRRQAVTAARTVNLAGPVRRAVVWVGQRFDQTWTLDELAAAVDMSKGGLAKAFTAKLGRSPLALRDEYRVKEMGRLLTGRVTIAEAASRVGWVCPKQAAARFKDHTDKTPAQWVAAVRALALA